MTRGTRALLCRLACLMAALFVLWQGESLVPLAKRAMLAHGATRTRARVPTVFAATDMPAGASRSSAEMIDDALVTTTTTMSSASGAEPPLPPPPARVFFSWLQRWPPFRRRAAGNLRRFATAVAASSEPTSPSAMPCSARIPRSSSSRLRRGFTYYASASALREAEAATAPGARTSAGEAGIQAPAGRSAFRQRACALYARACAALRRQSQWHAVAVRAPGVVFAAEFADASRMPPGAVPAIAAAMQLWADEWSRVGHDTDRDALLVLARVHWQSLRGDGAGANDEADDDDEADTVAETRTVFVPLPTQARHVSGDTAHQAARASSSAAGNAWEWVTLALAQRGAAAPELADAVAPLVGDVPHHMVITFNADVPWYSAVAPREHEVTDTGAAASGLDLVAAALHELAHGLFLNGNIEQYIAPSPVARGKMSVASMLPSRFDTFLRHRSLGPVLALLAPQHNCTADDVGRLRGALTDEPDLVFDTAMFTDAGSGAGGGVENDRRFIALHAPPAFEPGSSVYHLASTAASARFSSPLSITTLSSSSSMSTPKHSFMRAHVSRDTWHGIDEALRAMLVALLHRPLSAPSPPPPPSSMPAQSAPPWHAANPAAHRAPQAKQQREQQTSRPRPAVPAAPPFSWATRRALATALFVRAVRLALLYPRLARWSIRAARIARRAALLYVMADGAIQALAIGAVAAERTLERRRRDTRRARREQCPRQCGVAGDSDKYYWGDSDKRATAAHHDERSLSPPPVGA